MRQRQSPLAAIRWLVVRNTDNGQGIPPYAVMKVVGQDIDGTYQVSQPDGDNLTSVLLNGPIAIPPGERGQGHLSLPGLVAFDKGFTPQPGDSWGTMAGDWRIHKSRYGFTITGSSALGANADVIAATVDGAATATAIVRKTSSTANADGLFPGFVQLWVGSKLPGCPWEDGPPCLIDDANAC